MVNTSWRNRGRQEADWEERGEIDSDGYREAARRAFEEVFSKRYREWYREEFKRSYEIEFARAFGEAHAHEEECEEL